jgi:hypothetical protein
MFNGVVLKKDGIFKNSVQQSLWECPVWREKTPFSDEFNKELLQELYDVAYNFDEKTSKNSLLDYDCPRMQEVVKFKTKVINDVVNQYMAEEQRSIFIPSDAWVNVSGDKERIELHAHPDTSVTCTYYIQTPDDGGDFYYVDSGKIGEHKTQIKKISPQDSEIIFFPSYVLHGVETNKGRYRISLTTDFKYQLTEDSKDKLVLKSYIDSMKRIKDL